MEEEEFKNVGKRMGLEWDRVAEVVCKRMKERRRNSTMHHSAMRERKEKKNISHDFSYFSMHLK